MIVTVFIVIVINCFTTKQSDSKFVWTHFENQTGLGNSGGGVFYVMLIGLLNTLYGFSGYILNL